MTTNTKPKSAIPNATDQLRERRERASREVLNEIGAATSRAADVMTCCCSNSIRLTPKSWQTRSLLQFVEVSTDHARLHFVKLSSKLSSSQRFAQQVSLSAAEPLKTGLAKADRSA